MQLTHAGCNGLLVVSVPVNAVGGVLASEAVDGLAECIKVLVVLGFDGHGNDGIWHIHGFLWWWWWRVKEGSFVFSLSLYSKRKKGQRL